MLINVTHSTYRRPHHEQHDKHGQRLKKSRRRATSVNLARLMCVRDARHGCSMAILSRVSFSYFLLQAAFGSTELTTRTKLQRSPSY